MDCNPKIGVGNLKLMKHAMVSIIIPVYNVEKYVGAALTSALGQSCKDIEVIVVDDCGTDGSMKVVEEIAEGNPYASILHHERNRGLSAGRNTGIQAAKGDWLYFFDSDDILAPDCVNNLVTLAEAYPDADMIVGQYDEFKEGEAYHPARWTQQGGIYAGDAIGAYMEGKIPTTAWNKLVRKDFLLKNNLLFVEGLVHEDALWSFETLCLAKKVVVSDAVTYHYLQRPGSLDKQKNAQLHSVHYNKVYCLQAKFVFEHGLQNDVRLYHFIEKHRYQLLTDVSMIDEGFGRTLYHETRQYPYWNRWHRFLPEFLGFIGYIRLRCWYLKAKQIK